MRMLVCLCLVTSFASAQREETDVEWQKHHAKIEYNVVNVGQHKLDELQVGQNWRMGQNSASQLRTDMALLVGDVVVVPGMYRVGIHRDGEKDFSFVIEGGSQGETPPAAPTGVLAKGELKKSDKPHKKLEVTLQAGREVQTSVQPAKITVTYGENQLVAGLSLVGEHLEEGRADGRSTRSRFPPTSSRSASRTASRSRSSRSRRRAGTRRTRSRSGTSS